LGSSQDRRERGKPSQGSKRPRGFCGGKRRRRLFVYGRSLVLQEKVDMSEDDRRWLRKIVENSVVVSPSRLKLHKRGGRRWRKKFD